MNMHYLGLTPVVLFLRMVFIESSGLNVRFDCNGNLFQTAWTNLAHALNCDGALHSLLPAVED